MIPRFCALFAVAALVIAPLPAQETAPGAAETPSGTADELWQKIQILKRGPAEPPASREEAVAKMREAVSDLGTALDAFLEKYSEDARAWEARLIRCDVRQFAATLGMSSGGDVAADLGEISAAGEAPAEIRMSAKVRLAAIQLEQARSNPNAVMLAALDEKIDALEEASPQRPDVAALRLAYADVLEDVDPEKADALWVELEKSANPEIVARAKQWAKLAELKEKPLDLEFTSLAGEKVDLKEYRGKVVLLDFWATWCGPCILELPNVLEAYWKLHGRGFEIIGISLDQDRDTLEAFVQEHKIPWPQYFDGKGWENEISSRFGIQAIPAKWLLDKEGKLVSTSVRGQLEEAVEKQLAR